MDGTLIRRISSVGCLVLLVFATAVPSIAQEARWKELSGRVSDLCNQGKYVEALPVAQEALSVAETTFGSEHPNVAASLYILASLYSKQGQHEKAEPLYRRTLVICEKIQGPDHPDVATLLNDLAWLYSNQGKYEEAELLYRRALSIREKVLGPDHPDVANSLKGFAMLYSYQRKYGEAEPLYKRALAICEKAFGPEHPVVATLLHHIAEFYRFQRKYGEAEPLYRRTLGIKEKTSDHNSIEMSTWLNDLAILYADQGKYGEAEPLLRRALAIKEKNWGPDHPDLINSLKYLAEFYKFQGKYGEAEPLFRRALAIEEKALGPDDPYVANSLAKIAVVCKLQGKYEEAETLYRRALAIEEKAWGPDNLAVATSLNNLGLLYDKQGRYGEAEPLYRRALAIREKALGPDSPDVAFSLNSLGGLFAEQGRYGEAEPLHRRALAIDEKVWGPDHPEVATSLNSLAGLYAEQGRYSEAEPLYRRALAIHEKVLGSDHPVVADNLNSLAVLYSEQGRYGEAEPLHRRALAIREKALGPDHPDVAQSLNNLGALYHAQGRYGEAEPLCRRALAIFEKALGPDHPDMAYSLSILAVLYYEQGRYGEVEPLYRRALAIREKAWGSEHPDVARSLNNLAALYHAQGLVLQALPFYDRSLAVLGKQFDYYFTYMSEKERLAFLDTVSFRFRMYLSFCLSYRDKHPELVSKMYDVVLWQKGFIAQSVAALRARIQANGDAEALRLLDHLTGKKSQLAKLALAPAESDPQKLAARRAQVEELEKEANELERELVARSAALGEEKRLARITWQQVRDALKPGEAAVEVVRFRFFDGKKWTDTSYYVALVLRRESQQPEFVVLGTDLEGEPLADYRGLTDTRGVGFEAMALGRRFYTAFWQPLEAKFGDAKRIYISPDGELNQVSLGIVPRVDGRLLMEAYDLRTVNSTKDLLRGEVIPSTGAATFIGNPKFDMSEAEQKAALASERSIETGVGQVVQVTATRGSRRSRDLAGETLKELPWTEKEVAEVSALLRGQGWKVQAYTGPGALEERVKGVRQPRVLHLATHGFFEKDEPQKLSEPGRENRGALSEDPMLRSGVYLAGANRVLRKDTPAPDLEDGVLTAYEASQLNLRGTELVVLSACGTGLGKTEQGEGVFGLRRGLQVAGAEAVLMSLWSVPDEETRELMGLFYGKWLAGAEKHEALREAQLEMRQRVKARYGRDLPYYWGAFVLVGR